MPTTLNLRNSHCSSLQTAQNLRVLEDSGCEMEQTLDLLTKETRAGCIEDGARPPTAPKRTVPPNVRVCLPCVPYPSSLLTCQP